MPMPSIRLTLGAMVLACIGTTASASDWEPMVQGQAREDIRTWVRDTEGMAVKAFRGVTEVHQPVLTVLALLADIPNLSAWVYQCQSSVQPSGWQADHTYARFKGIWPASDRDVLFQSTVTQQPDGTVVVASRQVVGYPAQDGFVRMPLLHNTFRLTPLKARWTRVEFETQVDLGGMVPTWLANMVSTKAPLVTLSGLRQQVNKPAYQIQDASELPTHYNKGQTVTLPAWHLTP